MSTQAQFETDEESDFRIITNADIKNLPDKLTVDQLFELWYPVPLPDPPFFFYPSDIDEHCYVVEPDWEMANDKSGDVPIRSIVLFKYTAPTKLRKEPVWGKRFWGPYSGADHLRNLPNQIKKRQSTIRRKSKSE